MKIVIWGLKLHSHTHSYIHYGYWRAAEALGHEVHWYDDEDDVSSVDFSDSVFITEHRVCENMPLRTDCKYFIHWIDKAFIWDKRDKYSGYDVYNYIYESKYYEYGPDFVWPSVEKIGGSFYHEDSKTFITKWATDLLPEEIDECPVELYDDSKESIFFVGSMQGENIQKFSQVIQSKGKNFVNVGGYTGHNSLYSGKAPDINQNISLTRDSFISFDIREKYFFDAGYYYPCRIFKSISYGKWCGSNMPALKELFGDYVTFDDNLDTLYDRIVDDYKSCTEGKMREAMNFIRDNHTYINRLNDILAL